MFKKGDRVYYVDNGPDDQGTVVDHDFLDFPVVQWDDDHNVRKGLAPMLDAFGEEQLGRVPSDRK